MPYVNGTQYIRNSLTGAVFPFRDSLVGLTDLEVVVADGSGNLTAVPTGAKESAKLNPTKTPEKKEAPVGKQPIAQATKVPTMKPVDV